MELKLVNVQGQDAGLLNVNEAVFGREYNEALIHQVVTAFLANARSGNNKQKTRSEISRSTKKPWNQLPIILSVLFCKLFLHWPKIAS